MTFAIVETGGKQVKVSEGAVLSVEKLAGEHKEGDKITFDKVLLIDDGKTTKVGTPYLDGVSIEAEFVSEGKGKKILVRKFKRKTRYSRRLGHRQPYTKVKIATVK